MRGYHKCSLDEAARLAAFTYRVLYGEDPSYLDNKKYVMYWGGIYLFLAVA